MNARPPHSKRTSPVPAGLSIMWLRSLSRASLLALSPCIALAGSAGVHAAQPGMGGGGMPGGGPGGPGAGEEEEKEGPAEEAPKDKEVLRPITPVPAQPAKRRRVQLFELDGYLRTRADFFHRLNFGYIPGNNGAPSKFFQPPSEKAHRPPGSLDNAAEIANNANCRARQSNLGSSSDKTAKRCGETAPNAYGSANLRLRMRPTLNITDTVRVHATIDALDNLVLGSTPDSFSTTDPYAPLDIYTRSQVAPQAGINSVSDSIVVKHAYGDILFGWGMRLRFGRMPRHWGMGMLYNSGFGYDRAEAGDIVRSLDTDYGDSQDSVELSYEFGRGRRLPHTLIAAYNWAASGATTGQLWGPSWSSGQGVGQEFSVEKADNVHELFLALERRDAPELLRRKVSLGNPVMNYGIAAWLRFQSVDRTIGAPGLGDGLTGDREAGEDADPNGLTRLGDPIGNLGLDDAGDDAYDNFSQALVHRRAAVFTPNIWARLSWRTMRIELEAAAVLGRFRHRDLDQGRATLNNGDVTIEGQRRDLTTGGGDPEETTTNGAILQQFGYALEFKFGVLQDRFHIGLDHGFATGDQLGAMGTDMASPYTSNNNETGGLALSNKTFRFNPAYTQDLLLFREVLGTVANAVYFRPWAAFYLFENRFSARIDAQYAFGYDHRATPSGKEKPHLGIELAGALRYHAIDDPIFLQIQYGVLFPFDGLKLGEGDTKPAQTVQGQVGIQF